MKYCIKVGLDKFPVELEEIPKIIQGMADNSVLILGAGVFSGKSINAIVRDFHAEKGLNYHYQLTGVDGYTAKDLKVNIPELLANSNLLKIK
jgi:hypothetical protein